MDLEKLKEHRNKEGGFSHYIGIETIKVEEGHALAKIDIRQEHYNYQNVLHGGLLFALADNVGGTAARTYGYDVVTVNANMDYLQAGDNVETLYARARVLQHGRRISRYQVELTDQNNRKLAVGNFTYYSRGTKAAFIAEPDA